LEQRRCQAVALRRRGYGPSEIAEMLKTTPQSVCRWVRACRRRGEKALVAKPVPGRPSKLNARQKRGLAKCLLKGASAFGFGTDLWTCPRVRLLIEQRYGVHYHVDHIPRLLASLGFSPSEARTPSD
jgi:transposase